MRMWEYRIFDTSCDKSNPTVYQVYKNSSGRVIGRASLPFSSNFGSLEILRRNVKFLSEVFEKDSFSGELCFHDISDNFDAEDYDILDPINLTSDFVMSRIIHYVKKHSDDYFRPDIHYGVDGSRGLAIGDVMFHETYETYDVEYFDDDEIDLGNPEIVLWSCITHPPGGEFSNNVSWIALNEAEEVVKKTFEKLKEKF